MWILTKRVVQRLVETLQVGGTHGGYLPWWLHIGIDDIPEPGEGRPLLINRNRNIIDYNLYLLPKWFPTYGSTSLATMACWEL